MMKYDLQKHNRKTIRLKGYDYTQAGLYFMTLCTQNRDCLFGDIMNGKMILNHAGEMAKKWHGELENKFHDIKCHEMIIMPNHIHYIIENVRTGEMETGGTGETKTGEHVGSPLQDLIQRAFVSTVVQWFKTMTTNEYIHGVKNCGWKRFDGKLWQRNYYEHIVRNDDEYQRISQYIINNPQEWKNDKLNDSNS